LVEFERLRLRNFKRFSGDHNFQLRDEGQMTVFAAQNGVGKTTLMDSIHIVLYGKRGFVKRYPKVNFKHWLANAYSIEAPKSDYPEMQFSLDIKCPIRGKIIIMRRYWLLSDRDGGYSDEVVVTIGGKPLELELGENIEQVSERWIESFMPHSIMRRFLVDGERLSELDTRSVDQELIKGIDDLLGIGLLDRLDSHLNSLRSETLRKMVPENKKNKMDEMIELSDNFNLEIIEETEKILELEKEIIETKEEMDKLNLMIQEISRKEGDKDNALRIEWVKRHSELNSIRKDLLEKTNTSLPFIISKLPNDLNDWRINKIRLLLEEKNRSDENIKFLNKVMNEIKPSISKNDRGRLEKMALTITEQKNAKDIDSPISNLSLSELRNVENRHIELNLIEQKLSFENILDTANLRFEKLEEIENKLREVSDGLDIALTANKLKDKAMHLGSKQAEVTRLIEIKNKKQEGLLQIDKQIEEMKSESDSNGILWEKMKTISNLREVLLKVSQSKRATISAPLSESFKEGFKLLSRKSERLKDVKIDPDSYKMTMEMRGFEGNWLDRDLSATEKQHVGLALLYALRKVGNRAYPVIIDTPTSRMDRDHKGWSVTRFYPALSHQVIVLATSDDLGDGLYEELKETNVLGCELLIKETTENSVAVEMQNLANFFKVK
jgi:DNA sulfur modification protein DndD